MLIFVLFCYRSIFSALFSLSCGWDIFAGIFSKASQSLFTHNKISPLVAGPLDCLLTFLLPLIRVRCKSSCVRLKGRLTPLKQIGNEAYEVASLFHSAPRQRTHPRLSTFNLSWVPLETVPVLFWNPRELQASPRGWEYSISSPCRGKPHMWVSILQQSSPIAVGPLLVW